MTHNRSVAGGFFLSLGIVAGLIWGAATGQAMRGVLLGTIVGAVAALLIWIFDRRKRA